MSTYIHHRFHFTGGNGSVLFQTVFQFDNGGIFAVIVHILFTQENQLDRLLGFECQGHTNRNTRVHLDAGSERTANRDAMHINPVQGNIEYTSQ